MKIVESKINVIKGLLIILVVIGHCCPFLGNFIYLFHMSLFFVCSGFCYTENKYLTKIYIQRKLKKLYLPCVASNLIFLLFNNSLCKYGFLCQSEYIYPTNMVKKILKVLLFGGGISSLLVVNWFFRALFFCSVLYHILNQALRKICHLDNMRVLFRSIVCVFFLVSYWALNEYFHNIISTNYFNFFLLMPFYDLGQLLKTGLYNNMNQSELFNGIILVLSIASLIYLRKWRIELINNEIVNPVFFLMAGVLGLIVVFSIARQVKGKAEIVFGYLGQNSIYIMLFHLISFKMVDKVKMILFDSNVNKYKGVYIEDTSIWYIYTVVGIIIPICIGEIIKQIKGECLRMIKNTL